MKFTIPHSIKIGGHHYEIKLENRRKEHGIYQVGSCSPNYQKIWIDNNQHEEGQVVSLIHEIIEAINTDHDLNLPHQTISTLSECLFQILNDSQT